MKEKPSIFIASSVEGLKYAKGIQEQALSEFSCLSTLYSLRVDKHWVIRSLLEGRFLCSFLVFFVAILLLNFLDTLLLLRFQ